MKTIKKNKPKGLGYLELPKAKGFDWNGAMTVLNPDEKIDKGGGFPPAFISQPNKGDGKIYFKKVIITGHEGSGVLDGTEYIDGYSLFKGLELIYKQEIDYRINQGYDSIQIKTEGGYTKTSLKAIFQDNEEVNFGLDISPKYFNPYNYKSIHDYIAKSMDLGNAQYVLNFNGFSNPAYRNEPTWKPNYELLRKKKEEEERKKKENPEGYRFRGSRYDSKLTKPEIAKIVKKEIEKKYPYMKISIRVRGYNSIDGEILDIGFNPFRPDYEDFVKNNDEDARWIDDFRSNKPTLTDEAQKIIDECDALLQSYNFDDSDSQTDYFHVNFYGHIGINSDNHVLLYIPESKQAQRSKKWKEESKLREEKAKAKRAERKSIVPPFKYGDIITTEINWRGGKQSTELGIIKKVPNGEARVWQTFDIALLTPIKDQAELEKNLKQEKEYNDKWGKRKAKKAIYVIYIDSKPYTTGQYLENRYPESLKAYEGNWTHWLKEAQIKEQKEAEAKAQLQAQRKAQAEAKKAQPKPAKPTPAPKASITQPATTISKPSASNGVTIRKNEKLRGIEIIFGSFPSDETRTYIKSIGFKWNNHQKLWYTNYTEATWKKVNEKFGQSEAPNMAFAMARAKAKLRLLALKF